MQISNGTITVNSELGRGATFTVMLPLVEENTGYVAKPTIIRRRAMR